jgi:hypothetical protein
MAISPILLLDGTQIILDLRNLMALKCTSWVVCIVSLNLGFPDVSSRLHWGFGIWGENTMEVVGASHHIGST